MILFPPAKINLGLNVVQKRADGYHEIETLMYPIPLRDILEVLKADRFEFKQGGPTVGGEPEDNLCVRAYELMRTEFGISPVYMHLIKNIPMGAGLGGGSADAAFTIRAINELFDLKCGIEEMEELAARLGSDCPFFIRAQAQKAGGRGEILEPSCIDLSSFYLKLVHPGIHISTATAYRDVKKSGTFYLDSVLNKSVYLWGNELNNSFEESAFREYPELAEIKKRLYKEGAVYAAMSGSGSTMFGLFTNKPVQKSENETVLRL